MLSPLNRLASPEISTLLRTGTRVRGEYIDFIYRKAKDSLRFAVIVSAKMDKRATSRNRMKRLVRESLQHLIPLFHDGVSGVIIVRRRLPDREMEVEAMVRRLLEQEKLASE